MVLILGKSEEELEKLTSDSIDLVITSPPYKDKDGFDWPLLRRVFQQLYRLQKNNTLFFLNFGHLAEDKMRPYNVCQMAIDNGYKLNDTIVWVKNHYKPIQGKRRLNNLSEFIFLLYKGEMPLLNRLAIGIPYVDKTNANRFNGGLDLHCPGNVWYINYETITRSEQKLHHDRFPVELPLRCIKLCGYYVKEVLDPFCGSATVGVACKQLDKNFIGIDKDKNMFNVARNRLLD